MDGSVSKLTYRVVGRIQLIQGFWSEVLGSSPVVDQKAILSSLPGGLVCESKHMRLAKEKISRRQMLVFFATNYRSESY